MATMAADAQVGAGDVRVERVAGKQALREFISFPFQLYRGDPSWVPPFVEERQAFFDQQKNPFFEHARCRLFLARRAGEVVGTVGAVVDDNHNQFHNDRMGAFGFFESVDDPPVAAALLQAAEDWVRAQGMAVIRGPLNFSINHEYGLLVEGFEEPPMVMMVHNPRYYQDLIERCGYISSMNLFAYVADLDERWQNTSPKLFRVAEKAMRRAGIRIRNVDMRHFEQDVQRVLQVYDQAWQQLWDFVPITKREVQQMGAQLKQIMDPDLVFIAETPDGAPVGVSVTLPDLNQALLRAGGGHMLPFGLAKFLWHRRHITQARLWAMGVVDAYRGRGIDAVFYVETARAALAKGYRRLEGSLILENNVMMNQIIEHLGGQRYRTYRIYEKALL